MGSGTFDQAPIMKRRPPVIRPFLLLFLVSLWGCSDAPRPDAEPAGASADVRARTLADAYLAAFFDRYPDQATYYGVPGRPHDRLPDNSLSAVRAWEAREDGWLAEARTIDPGAMTEGPLRATHAIVREALDGAIATRVCRNELWNVSQMTGWHVGYGYLVTIQPVGDEKARQEAITRWRQLPKYVDAEIANLREGLRLKYTAPRVNVNIVIGQIGALIDSELADSPFMSPAARAADPVFKASFGGVYAADILPALKRYRDFLRDEYLPAARTDIAVASNPNGLACYAAAVRAFSTLPAAPRTVHETGLEQVDMLMDEMSAIASRSFQSNDVPSLLRRLRTERQFLFRNRDELVGYSQAALERAKRAAPRVFGLWPKADVTIEPYPRYREKNAANEYNPPAEDGSRPGLFYINAYQAGRKTKAPAESTAFHETIPGHHLQNAIALERKDIHPIGRYLGNSGYAEGWALYAERLADELGLYSSDLDRLGMLSSQAFRAARLVVDSGIHTMGWSRQQAVDYMLARTAESADEIASEVDRYIVWPGQATAYMLGMLEIRRARDGAQEAMGARFDMKAFHDRVLEDGAVPISYLAGKIRRWAMISK
jgi:uncharacterized protein (DUF885 family)